MPASFSARPYLAILLEYCSRRDVIESSDGLPAYTTAKPPGGELVLFERMHDYIAKSEFAKLMHASHCLAKVGEWLQNFFGFVKMQEANTTQAGLVSQCAEVDEVVPLVLASDLEDLDCPLKVWRCRVLTIYTLRVARSR